MRRLIRRLTDRQAVLDARKVRGRLRKQQAQQRKDFARRLLAGGASKAEISQRTGLNYDAIEAVQLGMQLPLPSRDFAVAARRIGRCRTCGGKVQLPCYACAVREKMAGERGVS